MQRLRPELGRVTRWKLIFETFSRRDRLAFLKIWHLKIRGSILGAKEIEEIDQGKMFTILALNHRHGEDMLDGVGSWVRKIRKGGGL